MNLFRVDFVQGKTDAEDYNQIVHILEDTAAERVIHTLSISPSKLQSVSCYAREPKRLAFQCFNDNWITEYLLSGDYEHERYISHYEVKVYRDDALIFTGIIDTSVMVYNPAEDTVSFTCYDKIKLLSIYADLEQYYSISAGYTPQQILAYYIQKIGERIPVSIPISITGFTIPTAAIENPETIDDALQFGSFDLTSICALPTNAGGWSYAWHGDSYVTPKHGWVKYALGNKLVYFIGHKKVIQATYSDPYSVVYKVRYMGVILQVLSKLSMLLSEYNEESSWVGELSELDSYEEDYIKFYTSQGFPANILSYLSQAESLNYGSYYSHYEANVRLVPWFWGAWFPQYIHPGKSYETNVAELTNCLKTLQAVLMLYNATLVSAASGTLQLISKEPTEPEPIHLEAEHVVEMSLQRQNAELPDTSLLDILCGDTSILQTLAKSYLMDFHAARWQLSATIDNLSQYNVILGSYIEINESMYYVTEVMPDYASDEYKLKAWKI